MPKFSCFFLWSFLLLASHTFSQKKVLYTKATTEKVTIDGKFEEAAWKDAAIATDFVMIDPDNGKAAPYERRTEVKIIYDNTAIYIAATLYDDEPQKILKELTLRDNFSTADHFGVLLNGYNDGQQDYRFYVSSAGVQTDCIASADGYADYNWNAVWASHAEFTDFGWVVEMKIPYAAIRFPSNKVQTWGLNIYREIRSSS